jgi:hypothetical protein
MVPMQVPGHVQLQASERGRGRAGGGRHRLRYGEMRRRMVRRHLPAHRNIRHLPRQLRHADLSYKGTVSRDF